MAQNQVQKFLKNPPPNNEDLIRRVLRLMESLHREMALLALTDWQKLDLFVPELYQPLSALTKPSWGGWNWIIQELRKARKKVLYKAGKDLRNKFEQLENLNHILETLAQRVPAEALDQLKPLADFFDQPCKRLTLVAPLEWGIRLRNRIAHDLPDDPGWWAEVARVLKPLLPWLAEQDWIPAKVTYPSPWFYQDQGQIHHFNGLEGKKAVRYIPVGEGPPLVKEEELPEFSLALAALLGEKEKQEKNIKRLLEEMTPEEIRGVLMGDFLVGAPIGEGAFATVHKAIHLSTGAQVAVKILKDASDEEIRERFRQEAELLARINHHHILIVYDYGESTWHLPRNISLKSEVWFQEFKNTNLKHYIALEWIDGLSLDQIFHLQKIDPDASLEEALRNSQKLGLLLDGWKNYLTQAISPPMPEWEATLKEKIRILPRAKERLNQDWLTTWFREAALALQYIHDQGLVHRDLKPSNLMITRDGRLKVMDFGIARNLAEGQTMMTVTGAVLGTPAYMSPEQIRAQSASLEIGPASDIYSLCATFYELYTHTRCYDHDTTDNFTIQTSKLQGILPERPRERNRSLSWELNTLLLGGMEQEPGDRIETMQNLASDLQRFQMDEVIQYRRPTIIRRVQLTYRRNTALINTVVTFLAILVIGTSFSFYNINKQRNIAQKREKEAIFQKSIVQKKEEEARLTLAEMYAREGNKARDAHEWGNALLYYNKSLEEADNPAARIGAANTFSSFSPELGSFWQTGPATCLSYSPNNKILASTIYDKKTISLWDVQKSSELLSLKGHTAEVISVDFSPDGKTLASASMDKTIRFWDVATGINNGLIRWSFPKNGTMTFSPDSKTLALGTFDNTIHILNVRKSLLRKVFKGHDDQIVSISYSPDGKTLASGSDDKTIRIWDVGSGEEIKVLRGHTDSVMIVTFAPDGKTLVSSSIDNTARVWEWSSGKVLKILKSNSDNIFFPAVSSDVKTIASVSSNNIGLWDINSGKNLAILSGETRLGYYVVFSPDGKTLASSTENGFRLWDIGTFANRKSKNSLNKSSIHTKSNNSFVPKVLQGHADAVKLVTYSPDGKTLASASFSGTIRLWRASDGKETFILKGHTRSVASMAFNPDGNVLVSKGLDGRVRIWDVSSGKSLIVLKDQEVDDTPNTPLSPDGRILVTISSDFVIHLWDVNSGKEIRQMKGQYDNMPPVSFSPNGKLLASLSKDNSILIWEVTSGSQLARLKGHSKAITNVTFSPDGNTLASTSFDKTIHIWDVVGMKKTGILKGHLEKGQSVYFSPDGKTLISTSFDGPIRFWDFNKGKEISLFMPASRVNRIAFSPNGKMLAVASDNIYFLNMNNGRLITSLKGHKWGVSSISFSPDSRMLASSSYDKTIRLWPLGTADLSILLNRLRIYGNIGLSYELDLDGQLLPKRAEELAQVRFEAARNGTIPWLPAGGKRHLKFYKNQLEQIKTVKKKTKQLEEEYQEKKHNFSEKQLLWMAKNIPGAAFADGEFTKKEKYQFQGLPEIFKQNSDAVKVYNNTIKSRKVTDIEPLNFSEDFSFNALNTIINICTSDWILHKKEIDYINQAAKALSINHLVKNRFTIRALDELQLEYLMTIEEDLAQTERIWLTSIIFKVVQADGVLKSREKKTMDNIQDLIIKDKKTFEAIRKSKNFKFETLPNMALSGDLSTKILRFLIGITISEEGIDEQGLIVVKTVAERLKIEPDKVTEFISYTKTLSNWVKSSDPQP
jgi:WD40 repeat protein